MPAWETSTSNVKKDVLISTASLIVVFASIRKLSPLSIWLLPMTCAFRATGIRSCATTSVASLLELDLSATRFDNSTPKVVW